MNLKEVIITAYKEAVALNVRKDDLKRALRCHERAPLFLETLNKEFQACEQRGIEFTLIDVKETVYSLTAMFISGIEARANARIKSDLEKARLQATPVETDRRIANELNEEFGNGSIII